MTNLFIGLFLSTLITALLTTRLYRLFLWYGLNSIFLGLAALEQYKLFDDKALLISALLTLLLKGLLLPYLFKLFALKFHTERNIPPKIRLQYSILLIPAILVFTFYLIDPILHLPGKNYISLSIASLFLSFLLIIEHKAIFAKVIGFLMMENALFLLGMTATGGMPMLIELGIFFDLLMAVVVINLLFEVEHA